MTLILLLLFACAAWVLILGLGLTRAIVIPKRKTYGSAIGRGEPTSPQEAGVEGREDNWTLSDGTPSVGFVIEGKPGREASGGRGLGVLIVHGFCDSRFGALRWAKALEPFAEAIVIYDQRAHGDAGGRIYGYGAKEAQDVLYVLDQARVATGIERWVLYGQSAGAGVAMRAAVESDAVVGFIADGCYRHWDTPLPEILRARAYPVRPTIVAAGWMIRLLGVDLKAFDRAAWSARLTVPALFLHGEQDDLCPIDSAREVADAAEHGDFVSFPGSGHLDLHEVDPRKYEEVLTSFFLFLEPEP